MKKCNHHSFILKIKCPYYFAGDCTLEKISCGDRDCFLRENQEKICTLCVPNKNIHKTIICEKHYRQLCDDNLKAKNNLLKEKKHDKI